MLKKMMLLATAIAAIAAFVAPAAAQASLDWDSTGTIEGSGKLGSLSTTGLESGPASVEFAGQVEEGSSTGSITEFNINGPFSTNVTSCTAEGTVNEATLPWEVHLETTDTMTITNVTFINHYTGAGCAPAGVPSTVRVEGDVTLTLTGSNSADVDSKSDFEDLCVEGTNCGVRVDIFGDGTAATDISWTGPGVTGL
jgi:hypothetical protein